MLLRKLVVISANLFFAVLLVAACLSIYFIYQTELPNKLKEDKVILIKQGSSIRAIANKLTAEEIVNNHLVFLLKAKLANKSNQLKAGEYKFVAGLSVNKVIELLQSGKTHSYNITFPEGITSVEVIELINNNKILSGDNIKESPAEGSLLPETYHFSRNDTKQDIIKRMQKAMNGAIDSIWETRQTNLPIKTKEEALILASIIEKETSIAEERAKISGVFINRLNIGIALQTDPTVIYAITKGKKKLNRSLTYNDLKIKSPYNTYVVRGLPPAPIANAGIDSIKAAVNPETHKYLYFVADGTGGHVFAKSLKEHNRNVAKWRKIKRSKK